METVQDFLNLASKYDHMEQEQIKLVEELKISYRKEKTALEAKLNSITNYNNVTKKNGKVENKIYSFDSVTQNKLDNIDQQIQNNEEKRFREISAINAKCDTLKEALNAKCDTTKEYWLSMKRAIENKKDIVIKDLSSNIIHPSLCDNLDEAAYPKLTKMTISIDEAERKIVEYNKTKMEYIKKADEAAIKRDARELREQKEMRRLEEAAIAEKARLAFEKKRVENQIIQEQNYQKSLQNIKKAEEEEQERLQEIENKKITRAWIKNRLATLPKEYLDYYDFMSGDMINKFKKNLTPNEEIIIYIDSIKEQLDNYITFYKHLEEKDEKMNEKYHYLDYKQRFEIAQIPTKIKKIEKIKELYSNKVEDEKEYPI
jgi:hypothetical protein